MFSSLRLSMTWLHTWFGLVIGFVLMICFFFGTLSVFDREIDRWAIPQSRFEPQPMPSFDKLILPALQRSVTVDEEEYETFMPELHDSAKGPMTPRLEMPADYYWAYTTHRDPILQMGTGFRVLQPVDPLNNLIYGDATIDPRSGEVMNSDALKLGSEWFYPMHISLHWYWKDIGYWIVGLAALTMLAALVSGVIMHRKIFREFFTVRPWKQTQRSTLDFHNLSGVVALPFHFFFAFTGLVIFAGTYFPASANLLKPLHDQDAVIESQHTGLPFARSGEAAPLASVDSMMVEAQRIWAERDKAGEIGYVEVFFYGDTNSYVSIWRSGTDRVATLGEVLHFTGSTGALLYADPGPSAVGNVAEFLTGLHLQQFEHWALRWLYVAGGLLGCVCIATGFLFFVEKRKQSHAKAGSQASRIVDALAVGTVTGMVIAAIGMLVANRILPADLAGKDSWEMGVFWASWIAALLHGLWRSAPVAQARLNPAWREQCWALAVLAMAAVLLNWTSTGDHLIKTVFTERYWPVAGVDLSLLVAAALAVAAARSLAKREQRPLQTTAGAAHDNTTDLALAARVSHG